jgi:hypothetical protein
MGFLYENFAGRRYRQCFLLDKSCRKMCTIFSVMLRQQRKSDVFWALSSQPSERHLLESRYPIATTSNNLSYKNVYFGSQMFLFVFTFISLPWTAAGKPRIVVNVGTLTWSSTCSVVDSTAGNTCNSNTAGSWLGLGARCNCSWSLIQICRASCESGDGCPRNYLADPDSRRIGC